MKKAISLLSATVAAAGCLVLGAGTASASDRCVQTVLYPSSGRTITSVRIINVCSYTLPNVLGHVFNGPAGVDKRAPARVNLGSRGYVQLNLTFTVPSGSLTCGELLTTTGSNYGRDCITR